MQEITSTNAELAPVSRHLRLVSDLELIPEAGGQELLFIAHRGTYVRLSSAGAQVLHALAGSTEHTDIEAEIQKLWPLGDRNGAKEFLDQLIRSEALIEPGRAVEVVNLRRHRIVWNPGDRLPLRFRLYRPDRVLLLPIVTWVRSLVHITKTLTVAVSAVLILACLTSLALGAKLSWRGLPLGIVIAALVLHVLLHECSHVLACSFANVRIREAGIAILYWFIPVFYIDRTDSYRLRRKVNLVAIPLAGPLFDACASGITAIAAWCSSGEWQSILRAISLVQALVFLINLNPLLPTDGFHALEALIGRTNTRHRAYRFLLWRLGLRSLPRYLEKVGRGEQRLYTIYGLSSVAYVAILACVTAVQSTQMVNLFLEFFR